MLRLFKAALVACAMAWAGTSLAQEVERAPTPSWVEPLRPASEAAPDTGAAVRILALDHQVRIDDEGVHSYSLERIKVQTDQGLGQVSTVSGAWSPPRQRLEVHAVRIIRGDQVIDVLANQSFQTLRREDNLEQSMLDGRLTATLQPRDIRVGDIVETAFTLHDTGGVLAPHREELSSISSGLMADSYRLRASWPAHLNIRAVGSAPWASVQPKRNGDTWTYEVEVRNLKPETLPNNLPGRFYLVRAVQFTDFDDWGQASALMAPLFEKAMTLEPDSPLLAEIDRIRRTHATDAARAAAALRLVQDEIRYLALSMGEGGYVPMTADEVWRSRYGDCKGKTVMLLALLKGLSIPAEAAMVSTTFGDGLDKQAPLISWFDHVIVKAVVDGQTYWLDGTGTGDRSLAGLTPPDYRWALAVKASGAALEPIAQPPAGEPTSEMRMEMDATGGLDTEAPTTLHMITRGAAAARMRQQMAAIPAEQLQTMATASMNDKTATFRIQSVDTRYDDETSTFTLTFNARSRPSWVNSPGGGRLMSMAEGGLDIPHQPERTGLFAAYKDAPYVITHPIFVRQTVRVTLPDQGRGFRLEGGDQVVEAGGFRIERRSTLQNGVAEAVISAKSLVPEISAADMAQARTRAESLASSVVRLRAPADYKATVSDQARLDPGQDGVEDLVKRAEALWGAGDLQGALALLDAAIVKEPDHAGARRTRGNVRLHAKDRTGARADFDHAVELDPADVEALVGQGMAARADGRHADAVVAFSVALRLDPSHATALTGRGSAYHSLGRWERSLADYRAARTAEPASATPLLGELRALSRLGRAEEARALIQKELEATPNHYVALYMLVDVTKKAGRAQEALSALDAAVSAAPDDLELLTLRAEARALAGQVELARADYEAGRRLAAGDPILFNNLCWSQATVGFDLERALADCDVAVSAGEAAVIDSRAMVLLQLGRHEEATAAYDQALAAEPTQAASLFGRGLARLALGDTGGGEDIDLARRYDIDVEDDFAVFLERSPELAAQIKRPTSGR